MLWSYAMILLREEASAVATATADTMADKTKAKLPAPLGRALMNDAARYLYDPPSLLDKLRRTGRHRALQFGGERAVGRPAHNSGTGGSLLREDATAAGLPAPLPRIPHIYVYMFLRNEPTVF